jgi:hypothetical protein
MIPPFWDRMRELVCCWFGHREEFSEVGQCVSCRRCRRLLRGPLNLTTEDRATHVTSPDDGCPDLWPTGEHLDPPTNCCTCVLPPEGTTS